MRRSRRRVRRRPALTEQGSEQMREKEGDTRQKSGRSGERQSAEQCPLSSSLHRLARRLLQTGSDYSLPGVDGRNGAVQRSTLCAAHPLRARYRGHMRNRGGCTLTHTHTRTGWGTRLSFGLKEKGGPPLVAEPKHLIHAPRPRLIFIFYWKHQCCNAGCVYM